MKQVHTSGPTAVDMPTKPHPSSRTPPKRSSPTQSSPAHQPSPVPRPVGTPSASTAPNNSPPHYRRLRLQIDTGRTLPLSSFEAEDGETEQAAVVTPTPLLSDLKIVGVHGRLLSPTSPRTPVSVSPALSVSLTAPKSPVPVLTPQGYSRERIGLFPASSATKSGSSVLRGISGNNNSSSMMPTGSKKDKGSQKLENSSSQMTASENKALIFQMQRRYKIKR